MAAPAPKYLSEFSSLYAEFTEGAFLNFVPCVPLKM